MHTHILRIAAVLNSTIVHQTRDGSREVNWGKADTTCYMRTERRSGGWGCAY